MSELSVAKARLFDQDALAVRNFKMFPGSSRDTTPEQMAAEINKAISQIESGDFESFDLYSEDAVV